MPLRLLRGTSPGWLLFVACLGAPSVSSAVAQAASPEGEACAEAFHATQRLRREGKLLRAKTQAATCGQSKCAPALATECARWLGEIEESIPTVVLGARDATGSDVVAVRAWVDGEPIADSLDGRALPLDPGPHLFRFEASGQVREMQLVARQGEKNRRVVVDFSQAAGPASSQSARPLVSASPPKPSQSAPSASVAVTASRSVPAAVWVLGAAGIVGVTGFTYFGLKARSERDDLSNHCAPHCDPEDVDAAKRKAWIADVSLGVGIACLGLSGWLLLRRPERGTPVAVGVSPTQVSLRGVF